MCHAAPLGQCAIQVDVTAVNEEMLPSDVRGLTGEKENDHSRNLLRPRHSFSERSEEHTSELQSRLHLVCRLLLEKKKKKNSIDVHSTNNKHKSKNDEDGQVKHITTSSSR